MEIIIYLLIGYLIMRLLVNANVTIYSKKIVNCWPDKLAVILAWPIWIVFILIIVAIIIAIIFIDTSN